jgi:hypothetical protein
MTNTYHAAFWSSSPSTNENRYKNTHQKRTKQRGNLEQRVLDSWTWEEILEGPWAQSGEYRRPKEELEAAKAERRRYEEVAWQCDRHKRQPQIFGVGRHTESVAESAYRKQHCTGQAPCYAVERTVSPVRAHSPERYRPAPRKCHVRVGIQPGRVVLSVSGLRYAVSAQGILCRLCVLCLRGAGRVQYVLCLRSARAGRMWALSLREMCE